MVKVVKYEVRVKISGKKSGEEVRIFRKLKSAKDFVSELARGAQCSEYKVSGDEMTRECKGKDVTIEVKIIKHALKKYEVTLKSEGKEEKVVLPTLTEALSYVSSRAKELGLECKEPKLENGVRTVECEKEGKKLTAEIRVQKGSLPKGPAGKTVQTA